MGSVTAIEAVNRQLPPIDRVQAVLFDVDGTLADSDPYHYLAFRDMLAEMCYNDGVPITEEFFSAFISGKHNLEIGLFLFPDWEQPRRDKWLDDKEALFRRMAAEHLEPVGGLLRLTEWVKQKGFRRAAVTNAPRENAVQMIAAVGLTDFFEHLVIGSECARAKPFPDPYLKALEHFGVPAENAFAFEDSPAGLGAAVAAGLPVVGITTGNPGPALMAAGAAFLIKDYDDPALWNSDITMSSCPKECGPRGDVLPATLGTEEPATDLSPRAHYSCGGKPDSEEDVAVVATEDVTTSGKPSDNENTLAQGETMKPEEDEVDEVDEGKAAADDGGKDKAANDDKGGKEKEQKQIEHSSLFSIADATSLKIIPGDTIISDIRSLKLSPNKPPALQATSQDPLSDRPSS